MKHLGILCTFALLLFVIAPSRSYSQDRDDNKPKAQDQAKPQDNRNDNRNDNRAKDNNARQDENRQDQARPEDKARQDEARQNDNNRKADETRQQDERNNARQDQRNNDQRSNDQRSNDQRNAEQRNNAERNRPEEQHPADNRGDRNMGRDNNHPAADRGRHIPDDQFRTHFGREHHFHVQRSEIVNVQQPVVVYGGYSWELAEPWPSDWSYDDDCYIDEVNGEYFLFDLMHPGMQIAVFIVE